VKPRTGSSVAERWSYQAYRGCEGWHVPKETSGTWETHWDEWLGANENQLLNGLRKHITLARSQMGVGGAHSSDEVG